MKRLFRTLNALILGGQVFAAELPADRMLADYFREETATVRARSSRPMTSLAEWQRQRETDREQLREMLGLRPWPARTPLEAKVTGRVEHAEFSVENLHYQSVPGVYITANLYLPKRLPAEKLPAILYVSGHSRVREGSVSFGSKATYQHHGAWFARNGYVCLTIDSIGELAEIEGHHHGTHGGTRWWWNSRGYTPAGMEAWNAIRGLDLLESRPEVDGQKLGMTGRSGGGVATWWAAALDERVKVAVPVAGMTDLQNQVVDAKVGRHCDCMFMVNTYRWDYGRVMALIAPRPLLFSNSDKDDIFPLDGVVRLHRELAGIYNLYGAKDKLGLLITDGPHRDTQDLQVPAFRWFNRFLKGTDAIIEGSAPKFFTPAQLKVFAALPGDQRNTTIDQTFVPAAKPAVPSDRAAWEAQRQQWMHALTNTCFAGWPGADESLNVRVATREKARGLDVTQWEFTSQKFVPLPLVVVSSPQPASVREVHLLVLDADGWSDVSRELGLAPGYAGGTTSAATSAAKPAQAMHRSMLDRASRGEITLAYVVPRGIGPTAWSGKESEQIQLRRRFMLLGQTVDGMRVWDVCRALAALGQPELFPTARIHLSGMRHQAVNALYASLFATNVASLTLVAPPVSHAAGPDYLSVLRFLDIPQAAALAADRHPVRVIDTLADAWTWPMQAVQRLGWPRDRFAVSP